jgi:hypothetical protein
MAAYKGEEAAKAAAKAEQGTALVESRAGGGRTTAASATEGAQARGAGAGSGGAGAWDEGLYTGESPINKAGRVRGEIELVYDAENGVWKSPVKTGRASSFAAGEAAGERWLGPKILEAGGKVLRSAGPLLEAMAVVDTVMIAGTMANNFIATLNEPFRKAQLEKEGARWVGERLANQLRQLAAADPDAVITPDGHKFDPNNPEDLHDLLWGLSQNLYFGREPFDGLLTHITSKPTSSMGAAPGDTAAAYTLETAWKLMQTAVALEKAAGQTAKECLREQEEARSQLQTAMTIAGARAVAASDLATLPETASEAKTQTASVRTQTKALQTAFDEMQAAGSQCDAAAAKICGLAAQVSSATEDQVKAWQAQATADLFGASNALNTAQAKIDNVDVAVDQLRTATASLDGFRTSLTLYQGASGVADTAGMKPDAAFMASKAAAERASAARQKLGTLLEQLHAIPPQITTMLAPYVARDIEAAALDAEARRIGQGVEPPPLIDLGALILLAAPTIEAALTNQNYVEKAIGSVDLEAIITDSREALTAADNLRGAARAVATSPERYQALQRASQCFAQIKSAAASAVATDTLTPPSSPGEDGSKTADADSSKMPGAPPLGPTAPDEDLVVVPSVAGAESIEYMRIILNQAGFKAAFRAVKPKEKKDELTFADQKPSAGEKKKRGSTVVVFIYQKFESSVAEASPSPSPGVEAPGTVPSLVGLTLEQAVAKLSPLGLSIGGIDDTKKTDKPDKVNTIIEQAPPANAKIPADKRVSVTRYGGLDSKQPAEPAAGGDPGVDAMIPGPDRELVGEFDGTIEMKEFVQGQWFNKQKPMKVTIRQEGGKWTFSMGIPPNAAIGGPRGTVTVQGGVLRYEELGGGRHHMVATLKVAGNQLVGSYTYHDTQDTAPPKTVRFQATRSR